MRHLIALVCLLALPAFATPPKPDAGSGGTSSAVAGSTSDSSAEVTASPSATASAPTSVTSSPTVSHRAAVLTMSTAEAVRIAPECWRPADRFGRPISTPLFAIGGRVVRDDECWSEFVKQREHDRALDLMRLEIERNRSAMDRMDAEARYAGRVRK